MPAGLLVIVPMPVPALLTERENDSTLNAAVTDLAAFIETAQEPVPVQAPLQPENPEPAAGDAVRVTTVPISKVSVQSSPQLIPIGEELIVPSPEPDLLAVNV